MGRSAVTPASLHVDHIGSLLRPAALKDDRMSLLGPHDADHNLGAHANAELTQIEDGYIREVVKLQEDCGLSVVTDGDFRRRSWWTDFLLSFTGLSISYDGKTPITMVNAAGEKRQIAGIQVEEQDPAARQRHGGFLQIPEIDHRPDRKGDDPRPADRSLPTRRRFRSVDLSGH